MLEPDDDLSHLEDPLADEEPIDGPPQDGLVDFPPQEEGDESELIGRAIPPLPEPAPTAAPPKQAEKPKAARAATQRAKKPTDTAQPPAKREPVKPPTKAAGGERMIQRYRIFSLDAAKRGRVVGINHNRLGFDPSMIETLSVPRVKDGDEEPEWVLETLRGTERVPMLEAVMLHVVHHRAYWPEGQGLNNPPDCASSDGRIGHGDPGGYCDTCAYAEWGSKLKSRAQACTSQLSIFCVRPQDKIPVRIKVPPTSQKNVRAYISKLTQYDVPIFGIVSAFKLSRAQVGGYEINRMTIKPVQQLTEEETDKMEAIYRSTLKMVDTMFPIEHDQREVSAEEVPIA